MDAASIEQMNKVRVSLGMAPLPVPGRDPGGPQFKGQSEDGSESEDGEDISTLDKRQALADSNWRKLEAEKQDKLDRQKRKDAAKKARDVAQRFSKLEGKGLGDVDDGEEMDTRTWLVQQKKRQKKIEKARKLEEELVAREQQAEYTSKDLAGVSVAHEMNEFDDTTGEQVLTLKDAEIGDESGDDELENAELRAKEKLEERLKLKVKRPDYDPTEQHEGQGLLSKYDEEIDGKKQKRFTLDGQGSSANAMQRKLDTEGEVKIKGVKINLDMLKEDAPTSDYIDPSTIKVKKPKKKDRKTRRKAADDEDVSATAEPVFATTPEGETMEVDLAQTSGTATSRKRTFEFDDDDDLQAKLAEQRRQALKKRKKTDAAELARQMRNEMAVDEEQLEEGGMIVDETSEFVANLKKPEAPEMRDTTMSSTGPQRSANSSGAEDDDGEDDDGDTAMQSYADVDEHAELQARNRKEAPGDHATDVTATGLEDEDVMTNGIGASLNMLRKRGLIDNSSEDLAKKERVRAEFLASKQNLIDEYDLKAREQRDHDRRSGKWDRMSNRERDGYARQQNEAREQYISRLLAEKFNREYRPDVKLQYHDEFGRSMNQKEAFKHMSHMFHGKGSGKQKTEKRLKKIEDERKDMAKGVLNVGEEGGMASVQGREGRRQKQAGVRLQ